MIPSLCPKTGRVYRLTKAGFAVVFSFIIASCAKPEAPATDTWKLEPPIVVTSEIGSNRLQLRASRLNKSKGEMSSLMGDETASLGFGEADRNLELKFKSLCVSADQTVTEYSDIMRTDASLALISLVPPMTLTPNGMTKPWTCQFQLKVTNKLGSSHSFTLDDFKMNFAPTAARLQNSLIDAQSDAIGIRSAYPRRLICETWWTDSTEGDLGSMARSSRVNGKDNRRANRQPLCSVIELAAKARLVGYFRPRFPNPAFTWSREILIQNGEVPALFHQPLLAWQIRNEESIPVTYYVNAKTARLQLSGFIPEPLARGQGPNWSRAITANSRLTVEGITDVKTTASGTYFQIPAGASARLVLHSDREVRMYSQFNFKGRMSLLALKSELPIEIRTLSGITSSTEFAAATPTAIDSALRDPVRGAQDHLISNLVLSGEGAGAFLRETGQSMTEVMRMGPESAWPWCYVPVNGDLVPPTE